MNYTTWSRGVTAEVRAEMARQTISIPDLAGKTGLSVSTLRRRLNNSMPLALDELEVIARALDVEVSALLPRTTARTA